MNYRAINQSCKHCGKQLRARITGRDNDNPIVEDIQYLHVGGGSLCDIERPRAEAWDDYKVTRELKQDA